MSSEVASPFARLLRPLVRLMIAKGVGFAAASELLKGIYVEEAERHFRIGDKRMTESRLSLLTGLRRREVKRLREAGPIPIALTSMGPAPRVILHWATAPEWRSATGVPLQLPTRSESGPSFEVLAAEISRDIHPRSVLDTLIAAKAVRLEPDGQTVTLLSDVYLPDSDFERLAYLSANVGDHAEAAVSNVLSSGKPPFFERAAHFNKLTAASVAALDVQARDIQTTALAEIAKAAETAQRDDVKAPGANMRFRAGAFIFSDVPSEGGYE